MRRQARVSMVVMRRWEPHDPGRSCLLHTIRHYVINRAYHENASALIDRDGLVHVRSTGGLIRVDNSGHQRDKLRCG